MMQLNAIALKVPDFTLIKLKENVKSVTSFVELVIEVPTFVPRAGPSN